MSISTATDESISYFGVALTAKDAQNFLVEKGAPQPCPSCGHNSWSVSLTPGDGHYPFIGTHGGALGKGAKVAPVFFVGCDYCGLIHFHNLQLLALWKKQNQQEGEDA